MQNQMDRQNITMESIIFTTNQLVGNGVAILLMYFMAVDKTIANIVKNTDAMYAYLLRMALRNLFV